MLELSIFARKLPSLSLDEFKQSYEGSHVDLVNDLVANGVHAPMLSYSRHYLIRDHALTTSDLDPDFDVVVHSTFASMEDFVSTMSKIGGDPEVGRLVMENFDSFLDRSSLRYVVSESQSGGGEGRRS